MSHAFRKNGFSRNTDAARCDAAFHLFSPLDMNGDDIFAMGDRGRCAFSYVAACNPEIQGWLRVKFWGTLGPARFIYKGRLRDP